MKKAETGGFYVVKTIKTVDEAGADSVFRRKEEQRQKRRDKNQTKKIKKRTGKAAK